MGFFRKLYLFFVFRKKLLKIETDLKIQFNIRVDNIYRLYTVLNIPTDIVDEPYNFRRSDIDSLSRNYIAEFNYRMSEFLNQRGLTELYRIYDMEKVDKYSYLLVFGFSLLDTRRMANYLLFFWLPLFVLSFISLLIYIIIQ
jgi:hypothetical protein